MRFVGDSIWADESWEEFSCFFVSFGEQAWSNVFDVKKYLIAFVEVGVRLFCFVFRIGLFDFGFD